MTLDEIADKLCVLTERCEKEATARDLAEAQELVQCYIDELERLEEVAEVAPYSDPTDVVMKWMQ